MNFEVLTMVPIVGAGGSPEAMFPLGCSLELQSEQPNRKPLTEGLVFFVVACQLLSIGELQVHCKCVVNHARNSYCLTHSYRNCPLGIVIV